MDFERVSSFLSGTSPNLFFWVIGATFCFVLLIVFALIWRKAVSGRVASQRPVGGMHIYDVERMRKEGQISEEEYKSIKKKVAERALAETRQKRALEEERHILEEATINPDAVRELLPPEVRAKGSTEKQPLDTADEKAEPAAALGKPAAAVGASRWELEVLGDPLEGVEERNAVEAGAAAPKPSMNMPRVVNSDRGELDLLFEKGAISREEYERLKGFFKKGT